MLYTQSFSYYTRSIVTERLAHSSSIPPTDTHTHNLYFSLPCFTPTPEKLSLIQGLYFSLIQTPTPLARRSVLSVGGEPNRVDVFLLSNYSPRPTPILGRYCEFTYLFVLPDQRRRKPPPLNTRHQQSSQFTTLFLALTDVHI